MYGGVTMATQIDTTRIYTSHDEETRSDLRKCPQCQVYAVPRGLTSTRKDDINGERRTCPNCGHVYGVNSLLVRKVRAINITADGDTTEVGVGADLQLTAIVVPEYADDPRVEWKSSDEAIATVDGTGKVTGVAAGDVIISAEAQDGSGVVGFFGLTVGSGSGGGDSGSGDE